MSVSRSVVNGMFTVTHDPQRIMCVGNQAYAGMGRYVGHALAANEKFTRCGVRLAGDWQVTSDDKKDVTCLRCKKKI